MADIYDPSYTENDPELAAIRKKQAMQAALIDQQNTVDPNTPPYYDTPGSPAPNPGAAPDQGIAPVAGTGPAPTSGPDTNGWDNQIAGYYSNFLGRSGSPAEVNGWMTAGMNNGGGLGFVQNSIANSPEAMAYANKNKPAAPKPAGPVNPNGTVTPAPVGTGGPLPMDTASWLNMLNSFRGNFPAPKLPDQLLTGNAADAQNQQIGLLQSVLSNPDVYSEQNVRQMQEAQKEQALALQKSTNQRLGDQLAGMGRYGSGYQHAQERRTADNTMQQILSSNRDVSLGAASANNQSRLNALGTSQNLLGAQSSQALQKALGQAGLEQNANSQAIQAALGASGLSLNQFTAQNQNQQAWNSLMALLGMFNTTQTNNQQAALTN